MKAFLISLAVVLGSTSLVAAHNARDTHAAPAHAATFPAAAWRYALPNFHLDRRDDGSMQTLTGGPSGEPYQS